MVPPDLDLLLLLDGLFLTGDLDLRVSGDLGVNLDFFCRLGERGSLRPLEIDLLLLLLDIFLLVLGDRERLRLSLDLDCDLCLFLPGDSDSYLFLDLDLLF